MKRAVSVALVIVVLWGLGRPAAAEFSGRIELRLDGAVVQFRDGRRSDPKHLNIYAECDRGQWRDVWGESDEFNRAMHLGSIVQSDTSGDRFQLKVELLLGSDHWIKGGPASYDIDVRHDEKSGRLSGTFSSVFEHPEGRFEGKDTVTGRVLPPVPIDEDFAPVRPGEHPRLLMRESQLPALRAKAKTPFGKGIVAMLQQRDDPVSLGMLYQLTGDRSYAERAKAATLKVADDRDGGPFALGRFWGYRTSVVGAAYDLCYDAWEPEFRQQIEDYLDWILYKCLHRKHRVGTVNWSPGSNYTIVIHAGNGMAALALWGEKGPPPVEPLPPRAEAPRIEAPEYEIPAGVPVVKLEPGTFPDRWLWIGPFHQRVLQHDHPFYDYRQPVDCLASMGGMENARPRPGQQVALGKQTLRWEPLNKAERPEIFEGEYAHTGQTIFKCYKLAQNRENSHLFFYTVLENDRPGWYRFEGNFYEGKCFIAGTRILHNEPFYLGKGRFPLLVPSVMADGEYSCFFHFRDCSESEAAAFYADPDRKQAFEKAMQQYEQEMARWKAADGANLAWLDHAERLRRWNYLNLRCGMGEGGFQGEGEGYTLECHHVIHDYACCYRNMFGRSVTGLNDISHFAPRYTATTVWQRDRDGHDRPLLQCYGRGRDTISARYLARSIVLCPKQWQPAILWHWLKLVNTTREEILTESGARKAFSSDEYRDGLALAEALINFPLDVKPAPPDIIVPHVWEAKTRGFYAFRDNWSGPESIVAQIYAKGGPSCGWSQAEAGCFQIYGLGHEWTRKLNDAVGKTGSRWHDNVVMLPDDPVNSDARTEATFFEGNPKTGSGVVAFDMDPLYECFREVQRDGEKRRELYDAGIRGVRSFAADYSGRSGAPALFAVADRISGGKQKVWAMQLPLRRRDDAEYELRIEDNSFVVAYDDASMKATVVSPRDAVIRHAQGRMQAHPLSHVADADVDAIHFSGKDRRDGDFLVIITLQREDPPEVRTAGRGKARIGDRTVRFDGTKILLQ